MSWALYWFIRELALQIYLDRFAILKKKILVSSFTYIAPAELEGLLLSHPDILDVVVIPEGEARKGRMWCKALCSVGLRGLLRDASKMPGLYQ
ncbi:hypothetical protein E2562_034338 [Oryza meyeriana var. granulata]|uniref:AMP-binding enzyme C-terminal domain-containing protein n=1 Tax=Oryza meyeriana var. granulata TaxID=110450 RepID=A0A6G1BRA6_9ORYZ|nr:hypothetical protein E2562_034338 [Oryza meyeriana var. granulata]